MTTAKSFCGRSVLVTKKTSSGVSKYVYTSKISVNLKLNPICAGHCALCLSCPLKICRPFSGQLTICGAQHLLALTEYKCLANIPVWLRRKQKLCLFYSTPPSEGVESTRGNSVCKHRRSSSSQQSKGYHPSPNILLRSP